MECLHGLPASAVSTKNGKFLLCNKNNPKSCEFFYPDQDHSLCEMAMTMWRANGRIHPVCDTHQRLARMKVVKDVSQPNFGRPFFVCCDRENPCNFWQWGDRHRVAKTEVRTRIECLRMESQKGRRKSRPPFILFPKRSRKVVRFF